ncbi:unnamed protein product [Ambrosiozyma monospora]|uniref:Unnamed protein product n=1 Tax=Ambrosiozyma monospora TaxID=43982 RepID=A0ACB5SSJ9_AMBMO|nr:unnamed protein product [Ambrosiozyma monospora]
MLVKSIIATALLSLSGVASASEIALYWGQTTTKPQERLANYCKKGDADIFILSFMNEFSGPSSMELNFADACGGSETSKGLLKCEAIAEDIQTCQKTYGKKVFLSLGGGAGKYGFASDSDAKEFAGTLWNTFGAGSDVSSEDRPFGDAVVDGFDFDIESGSDTGYAALATKLRSYYAQDSSKTYYISAAPQCVYPDKYTGDLLANADVDYAFVQFYNNPCSVDGTSFNWDTWADYAAHNATNNKIKIFLGLPGSPSSAVSGYVDLDTIKKTVNGPIAANNANFGGIMMWDASSVYANGDLVQEVKGFLQSAGSPSGSSDSSSTIAAGPSSAASASYSENTQPTTLLTVYTSTPATPGHETSTDYAQTTSVPSVAVPSTASVPDTAVPSTASVPDTAIPSTASIPDTAIPSTTAVPVGDAPSSTAVPIGDAPSSTASPIAAVPSTTAVPVASGPSTTSVPAAASPSTAAPSSGYTDCSSLSGKAQAQCLNKNYAAGLYNGSAESCKEGETSCSPDGQFAVCSQGTWSKIQCGGGNTCFAYTSGNSVQVACNYETQKSSFTKRDSIFGDLFKRSNILGHKHHQH